MSKHNIFELKDRDAISDALTEMLRTGANQLIHQAVQIELEEWLAVNTHRLTSDGKAENRGGWFGSMKFKVETDDVLFVLLSSLCAAPAHHFELTSRTLRWGEILALISLNG